VTRPAIRDLFYSISSQRLKERKDVSRVLVYGSGLRYRAFRRELVRKTAANDRMIVGLLDDDVLLRGRYIGGIRIYGTINEAKSVIDETNADSVVIACEISDEWLKVVKGILAPTGVKVTKFSFSEVEV
jgi:FlaA1/EpsC-like NDP-sugar epimerase